MPPGHVHSAGELPIEARDDVPAEARRMVEKQVRASVESETKRQGERAAAFREVAEEFRKELRALIGTDGYDEYRALIREEKHRRAALLVPRGKLELSARDRQRLRQQHQKRLTAFLRKRGVSAKRLTEVDRHLGKRLAKLIAPEPRGRRSGPIPDSKVPRHILASKGDRRVDPPPPYDTLGFWRWWYRDSDEFTISSSWWGNYNPTGTLGSIARLEIWDADNSDRASDTLRSFFGFWVQLPKNTKKLKIWVHADLLQGRFFQHLATEWYGTSLAWFKSENALFSEVIGVADGQSYQERTAMRSWSQGVHPYIIQQGDKLEGTWDSGTITGGGWYLMEHSALPTPVPPPGGSWVWIWVGSETRHAMWVDDEVGVGFAAFKWKVNAITFQPLT